MNWQALFGKKVLPDKIYMIKFLKSVDTYAIFILSDNESDTKTKWALSLVRKKTSHVYLAHKEGKHT